MANKTKVKPIEEIEVIKPKVVKRRKGDKYTVLIPFSIGSGESKIDYKKDDTVIFQPFEAQQFINKQKIK